jgi:hypothetical protein
VRIESSDPQSPAYGDNAAVLNRHRDIRVVPGLFIRISSFFPGVTQRALYVCSLVWKLLAHP